MALCAALPLKAQTILGGKVTGNVQIDAQVSREDTAIGAADVPEKFLSNVFGNILYTNGNFTAGLRFESYLNPMLGFDEQYKGYGFANKFLSFQNEKYEFRCFLLRLGFIGDDTKAQRKILMENLAGSAAFKAGKKGE